MKNPLIPTQLRDFHQNLHTLNIQDSIDDDILANKQILEQIIDIHNNLVLPEELR